MSALEGGKFFSLSVSSLYPSAPSLCGNYVIGIRVIEVFYTDARPVA